MMLLWFQAIGFVEDVPLINGCEGGYAADQEGFGELANI